MSALAGCQDDGDPGQPKQAAALNSVDDAPDAAAPGIKVGKLFLPLPAPPGFVRLDDADPRLASLRAGLGDDRAPLAAFARLRSAALPEPVESVELAEPVELAGNLEQDGILLITTLKKWKNLKFSAAGFDAIKTAWQEASVTCTQKTLLHFEEAATGRLAALPAYTYNLGLAGYNPRQISYVSVVKSAGDNGEAIFACAIRSLLYRQGKILGLEYRQRLDNFSEIAPLIDRQLDYLEELQRLDGQTGSAQGGLTRETTRFIPSSQPELSAVTRP